MSDPDRKNTTDHAQDRTAALEHHLKTLEGVVRKLIPGEGKDPQSGSSNNTGDAASSGEASPSTPNKPL